MIDMDTRSLSLATKGQQDRQGHYLGNCPYKKRRKSMIDRDTRSESLVSNRSIIVRDTRFLPLVTVQRDSMIHC